MSEASERRAEGEVLAAYSLVGMTVVADFLDCSLPTAREMVRDPADPSDDAPIPGIRVGSRLKVDPRELAIYVLAEIEGVSREKYLERHGEATQEYARRYVSRIRKLQAGLRG